MNPYIRTYTGRKFPVSPKPEDVCIEDIATGLSRAPRWGGHTNAVYPVSAHSIFVAFLLPKRLRFEGLMHDGSEAYLADIPSPFKALLPDYKKVETTVMNAIAGRFGFSWPCDPLVKEADAVALYLERLHLFSSEVGDDVPYAPLANFPKLRWASENEWDWRKIVTATREHHAIAFLHYFNLWKPKTIK